MIKLSVIIVSYNVRAFLKQCLDSVIAASEGLEVEIIVVDNDSADDSVELVRNYFPQVILLDNKENLGYSRANNQGYTISQGKHILFLNPDTIVEEKCFSECLKALEENPDFGALGVRLVDGHGTFLPESKRGVPTPWTSFYKFSGIGSLFSGSSKYNRYYQGHIGEFERAEIEILVGAFFWVKREVLEEVGLFDESFFLYWEDTDLSYRILKKGIKTLYLPEVSVLHYKGESSDKDTFKHVRVFYKAMERFSAKHFPEKIGYMALTKFSRYLFFVVLALKKLARALWLPVLDAGFIYSGIYFIKEFWEHNYKYQDDFFPPELMKIAAPFYVLVWLLSLFYNGAYSENFKSFRLIRGVILGAVIISALTNFFEEYRFSRAIILLSTIYTAIITVTVRYLINLVKTGSVSPNYGRKKKLAVVGSKTSFADIQSITRDIGLNDDILGYFNLRKENDDKFLGTLEDSIRITQKLNINTMIFDLNVVSHQLLLDSIQKKNTFLNQNMTRVRDIDIILGSKNKNKRGAYLSDLKNYNIIDPYHFRNKRTLDVLISLPLILILLIPALFKVNYNHKLLKIVEVIQGKRTLLSFKKIDPNPFVKDPVFVLDNLFSDDNKGFINAAANNYSKDYSVLTDIRYFFKILTKQL